MVRQAPALAHVEGELIPAAGYIRVSTSRQLEKYSPANQRDAIRAFAKQHGYQLVLVEQDAQRGRVIERTGYQRILEGVRAGTIHAVVVFMFDRWGRDGGEWVSRARELERLRVPFLSVQEGREEGGMMRFIRAGMAEEYSRALARRVRPACEASARSGRYLAVAPFGYLKRYPEVVGTPRASTGYLEPDPATASVLQEIFRLYGVEGMSQPAIARRLNTTAGMPTAPEGGAWAAGTISRILHNPVYTGRVRYNHRPSGYYDSAAPGDEFIVEGIHQPLVTMDMWDAVQARLAGAATPVRAYKEPRALWMGEGILRCATCGARMMLCNLERTGRQSRTYRCAGRKQGASGCEGSGYSAEKAHAALVAQVSRIRYQSFDEGRARDLADDSGQAARLVEVDRLLARLRAAMRRHMREFAEREDDPSAAEIQEHRTVGRELAGEIATLEAEAALLREAPASLDDLRAVHRELESVDVPAMVARLVADGDHDRLAVLVRRFIASAVIDRRVPERYARWVHARVEWTDDTAQLLDLGSIALAPDDEPPADADDPQARHREAVRSYRARVKAASVDTLLAAAPVDVLH